MRVISCSSIGRWADKYVTTLDHPSQRSATVHPNETPLSSSTDATAADLQHARLMDLYSVALDDDAISIDAAAIEAMLESPRG
ncbi:MAG: hypothetical protein GC162_03340 [Planctomycetes bacterium]|nr:hypothetical protein [Planctomycetota bacterium]